MMNKLPRLAVVTLWLFMVLPAFGGEVIDRIVATVNGHVILQSDWDDASSYEAFIDRRSLDQLTPEDRKATLDRLIDQELLREQIQASDFPQTPPAEVQKRIQEIRAHYPEAQSQQAWSALLSARGLTESDLESRVVLQLNVMRLVDARLRPTIQIDARSIESYYQETLIPQLRQAGATDIPLADATPKIKELLTQQKMNVLLTAWLQNLRAGSDIRTEAGFGGSAGEGSASEAR